MNRSGAKTQVFLVSNPQSSYFLYGYYGAGNFGDDILLCAAIENILAFDPDARFLIRNHGPIDFLSAYGNSIILTDIERVFQQPGMAPVKFLKILSSYWAWMQRTSHLVVGGGTLIHDYPYLKSTLLLLCLTLIAKLQGRKVIGIGLGTKVIKTGLGRLIVKSLIGRFERLCLRDEDSYDRCRALAPAAKNLALTSDLAYALDWMAPSEGRTGKGTIALTLVDYIFDGKKNAHLPEILAGVLTGYARQGYSIRLIALQRGDNGDAKILQSVMDKIPRDEQKNCELIVAEATREGVTKAYAGVSLMLGMRFHALVFAAINGIPFVGLEHEPKINAIAREFGMPALKLQEINNELLNAAVSEALTGTIDKDQLMRYQAMALDNFIFLRGN
jgi:polysaccharide pyruvyl transferase WcaK-like protein